MRYLFVGILAFLLLLTSSSRVFADGMIIPSDPLRYINETDQRAVIWHDGKKQTMILSITFSGDADKFAWVIPVPSKPEVSQGFDELFTGLNQLTNPYYNRNLSPAGGSMQFGATLDSKAPSVSVIETKKVDIYDIAVLTANDTQALQKWLEDNEFEYPKNKEHLLTSYVSKGWYFVAAKVTTEALGYAAGGLKTGHATPLKLTFDSDKIVYPLKISGKAAEATGDDSNTIAAYSFEDGTTQGWPGNSVIEDDVLYGKYVLAMYATSYLDRTDVNPRNIHLTKTFNNLKIGTHYVFSAYAKANYPSLTGDVFISTNYGESSKKLSLSTLKDWERLSVSFVAKSASVSISLETTSVNTPHISWDAIMLEKGVTPGDFIQEKIPQDSTRVVKDSDNYTQLMIYIFSDHKQEAPGWNVEYAGKVSSKAIEKLAYDDNGDPWMRSPKKMYLTKLTKSIRQSEMTSDVYFRDSVNDNSVGAGNSTGTDSLVGSLSWRLLLVFGLPLLAEVAIIVYIWRRRYIKVWNQ